jgi:nucleoside-diphosphate-sugar epimerase
MKKLLFTGGTGFFGKNVMPILGRQYEVTTCGITIGNVLKTNLAKEVPPLIQHYDTVLHAAGKAHSVPKNIAEENDFFDINLKGTVNLCAALEKSGIPDSFIFISSVSVYGLDHGELITESHSLLAKDPYGVSKIQAESFVQEWCKSHNVVCTILRLPLVVGANPPGNLGAMIRGIEKGYYFNIAGGKAKKSMVLAGDVANILLEASEIGGVYNLTDGYHPCFFDLSNSISKQYRKSRIINLPFTIAKNIALVGDIIGNSFPLDSNKLGKITSELTFDDSKARKILGWNPNKVIDYYQNKSIF